jgi:hypothetical protein
MNHRDTRQAGSRIRGRIAVILAGAALLSWAGPGANAFWTATSNGGSASASADAVGAGATPTATVSGGSVTLAWNASTTLAGRPVTSYTVARYDSASGGNGTRAAGTCPTVKAGLGCTDQGVPTGTWYYTVTPVLGPWQGAESVRSAGAAVDTTPPAAPTVVAPTYVYSGNVAAVQVNGKTETGASIALSVSDGVPAHTVSAAATADSSGFWNATVNLTGLNAGTVTYRAVATDTVGNQGTAPGTATSTKDVTAPTVMAVALADAGIPGKNGSTPGLLDPGDKVTITFSESMDASTICSKWVADGTVSGNGQVMVNVSAGNVLSVTVTSAGCTTSRIGTVALAGAYYGSGTLSYGGNGSNASSLSWNAGAKTLTITLGARASGTVNSTAQPAAAPSFTPASGITDAAGNALPVTTAAGSNSSF